MPGDRVRTPALPDPLPPRPPPQPPPPPVSAILVESFTSSDGVRVRPSAAMIARGVAALHAVTEHRSTKRDPRGAVEAILIAALNP